MLLGGSISSFGIAIQSLPARLVPAALDRVLEHYRTNHLDSETFRDYVLRYKVEFFRELLTEFARPPAGDEEMLKDWGDEVNFSLELGRGECAS